MENSTHQAEHTAVSEKLQDLDTKMFRVYDRHHNGDKKSNKEIMDVVKGITEARTMVSQHAARTLGDDNKLAMVQKYEKFVWVAALAFATSIGRHLYTYLM